MSTKVKSIKKRAEEEELFPEAKAKRSSKVRPLRIFKDNKGYYALFGKQKKYLDVDANYDYKTVQKKAISKLKGSISPSSHIAITERPIFSGIEGLIRKPLTHISEIKSYKDTDEGLKSKKTNVENIIESIERKTDKDIPLNEEEKKLAQLYVQPKNIAKEEKILLEEKNREEKVRLEQKDRDERLRGIFRDLNVNNVDFPIRAWNGLHNGSNQIIDNLALYIRRLLSLSLDELWTVLGAGGYSVGTLPNIMRPTQQQLRLTRDQVNGDADASNKRRMIVQESLGVLSPQALNLMISRNRNTIIRGRNVFHGVVRIANPGQIGEGEKLPALYNDEIEEFFSDEKEYPNFGGVISADQIMELPKKLPIGFVMNLDGKNEPGSHWVAVYISGDSVEYFDSLGNPPSTQFKKDIKKFLTSMKVPVLMKFKTNTVPQQHGSSYKCGYHAIRFLDERMKYGTPYKHATHFANSTTEGDKKIKEEFDYI